MSDEKKDDVVDKIEKVDGLWNAIKDVLAILWHVLLALGIVGSYFHVPSTQGIEKRIAQLENQVLKYKKALKIDE